MPRSSSTSTTRRPILGKAMAILTTLPLTPISKARAARTLLLFKRRRARRLRHYSYAYVGEYQFSPSGSPLLLPRPPGLSAWRSAKQHRTRGGRARAVLASLFCCAGGDALDVAVLDGLPPLPPLPLPQDDGAYDGEVYGEVQEEEEYEEDQEEEVDSRAERFIERFYQEMRMQETRRLLI
ncbi:uncharacterized protein LOC124664445 [Lolium rigidum]|uniref:uncharacterized protein LOC124664445 n=1 Tax=Lolium rigidum TaxID=89674 RepID=UPI001F5C7ED2|nr:uncharacterized protein LOC124664445 [Lolium rigidum]